VGRNRQTGEEVAERQPFMIPRAMTLMRGECFNCGEVTEFDRALELCVDCAAEGLEARE
jgi:hypothetical protein